jgi:hypothetical protein
LKTARRIGRNIANKFTGGHDIALRVLDAEEISKAELSKLFEVNLIWNILSSYISPSELPSLGGCAELVRRALASNPRVDFNPFAPVRFWLKRTHSLRISF